MKKTQFKELFRNIRKTLVSFLSILAFVMFSAALFLGLTWASDSILLSADRDFQNYAFHDLEIVFPYGATNEDIETLSKIEGVSCAEGIYRSYQLIFSDNVMYQVSLSSLTKNINMINQLEGNLPTSSHEILVGKTWAKSHDVKIGDIIAFSTDYTAKDIDVHALRKLMGRDIGAFIEKTPNEDGMKYLNSNEFVVCGLGECPTLISTNESALGISPTNSAPVNCMMFVDESAFDEEAFLGYSYVYLRSDDINKDAFNSENYKNNLAALKDRAAPVAKTISVDKYNDLIDACDAFMGMVDSSLIPEVYATVLDRTQSQSVALLTLSSKSTENLKYCLSGSLLVIAMLICYSVVSRIIYEQRVQIGTKKALGFTNGEIILYYLFYTGLASVIGVILGIIIARFFLEPMIYKILCDVFIIDAAVYTMSVLEPVIISLICLVFILAVTYLSCKKVLKSEALSLLNNTNESLSKHRFYEKLKIWKKLPLLTKTIVNNFFNDKKRVIGTIIGVIGVMSLMTCGLTFSMNVSSGCEIHFDRLQNFDYVIYHNTNLTSDEEIEELLNNIGVEYCHTYITAGQFEMNNGKSVYSTVFVTDYTEDFRKMMTLKTPDGKEGYIEDGLWICNAIAANNSLSKGDTVNYIDGVRGKAEDITIGNINEYYLMAPSAYMTKDKYMEIFNLNETPEDNAFLVASGGTDFEMCFHDFYNIEGCIMCYRYKPESMQTFYSISGAFVFMSLVFLFMAVMMALLVILNLMITFVQEKKRDLITLMINGYSQKEVKKYIYSDTIQLTIIGIIIGAVTGTLLGYLATKSICRDFFTFYFAINWIAILISLGVTALLVTIITIIALRRIKHFKLTDVT